MIKIQAIQYPGGIRTAICSDGRGIPTANIVGDPSVGKGLEYIDGYWTVVSAIEECET